MELLPIEMWDYIFEMGELTIRDLVRPSHIDRFLFVTNLTVSFTFVFQVRLSSVSTSLNSVAHSISYFQRVTKQKLSLCEFRNTKSTDSQPRPLSPGKSPKFTSVLDGLRSFIPSTTHAFRDAVFSWSNITFSLEVTIGSDWNPDDLETAENVLLLAHVRKLNVCSDAFDVSDHVILNICN